jgi:hypothetical protein
MGSSVPNGAKPFPKDNETRTPPGLSPNTCSPVRYCEPFKVEGTQEAQTIPEGAPMHHDCGLDQADLGEIAIPGYRIGVGVEENAVSAEAEPG